jgi:hypothetical protein
MMHFFDYALTFVLAIAALWLFSAFQAAAVEVKRKPRFATVTVDSRLEPADREMSRAA